MNSSSQLSDVLKIFSVYHKPSFIPSAAYIYQIHGGKAISLIDLKMESDADGENISSLNSSFCELTVLYNVWKNKKFLPAQYWGLCHYRRYFTLNLHWTKIKKKSDFYLEENPENLKRVFSKLLEKSILKKLDPATIILPLRQNFQNEERKPLISKFQFERYHGIEGWQIMESAILKLYPEYLKSFTDIGNQNRISIYNMMIAHHEVWNNYLTWLFNIVFFINKNFSLPTDSYQSRAIGFMAERLLNVYFFHHKHEYKIINMPIAIFGERPKN